MFFKCCYWCWCVFFVQQIVCSKDQQLYWDQVDGDVDVGGQIYYFEDCGEKQQIQLVCQGIGEILESCYFFCLLYGVVEFKMSDVDYCLVDDQGGYYQGYQQGKGFFGYYIVNYYVKCCGDGGYCQGG